VKAPISCVLLVAACVDVGSSEVVVDHVVNIEGFAIEERIVREPTFHDPIFDHRWRVRVDAARPPRVVDGHLAVPVGAQVLFRMTDGRIEHADTHGCPVTDPVYGLVARSIVRRDGQWRVVFESTTGHDEPAVEVRGSGSTWACARLEDVG